MISRLRGTILSRQDGLVELGTASGVVYELDVPLTILERVPAVGSEVELRTLHIVREDSVSLYGFMEAHERDLFRRLLGASGVGPRLALAMMSSLTATRLVRAIVDREIGVLTGISGVGRKTAERIVLELADRLEDLAAREVAPGAAGGAPGAVQALVALGYSTGDAERAVRDVLEDGESRSTEEILRLALKQR